MSTPFPIFIGNKYKRPTSTIAKIMAPPEPPPAKPSSFQHVEFQTADNDIKSVSKTERRISLKPPSTKTVYRKVNMKLLDQTSQILKISANQAINN